ncbi:MAG: hypothetical protein ABIQ86_11585 [Steroidobacteraceae bacterium]
MRGATLIELLIAMLLAGVAVAGALTGLAHAQRVWRDAERLARMHERAQYVFGTLEPELQMAGYFGSGETAQLNDAVTAASGGGTTCGIAAVLPLQPAVRVLEGNWSLPCAAHGQGAKPDSDTLIVRRASTRIAATEDGALQLLTGATPPELRDLFVRIYYIARAADGDARTPALRVKSLTAVAGAPAFVDTEVMPGVDDLQIELRPDSIAPRSVLVRLRIMADPADIRAGEMPPVLALERRFSIRNVASS